MLLINSYNLVAARIRTTSVGTADRASLLKKNPFINTVALEEEF